MTEVLSQKEIDLLCDAINAGDYGEKLDLFQEGGEKRKIKIYDFKRPDKFSREQIRKISMIYETFSRLSETLLSMQCRSMVQIHVASVDQLTYEEFIRSTPTPTTLGIINPDPLNVAWLLEIDPDITFAILSSELGWFPEKVKYKHELTEIETSIMEGIMVRIIGNLQETWAGVLELCPCLGKIETNPQFTQVVHPTEMVALVTLEAKFGEVEGLINVCMPYISLKPIMSRLSSQCWAVSANKNKKNIIGIDFLKEIQVPLRAELFRKPVTVDFLGSLKTQEIVYALKEQLAFTCNLFSEDLLVGKFSYCPSANPDEKEFIKIKEKLYRKEPFMEAKPNVQVAGSALGEIQVQLIVEIGRTVATLDSVNSLAEGNIIELDKLAGEAVDVFANNIKVAKAEVVVIDDNFGVRILEVLATQFDRASVVN